MTWVVDTSVLIDVLDDDPAFGATSAEALERALASDGLTISPVTYVELAPAFVGDRSLQEEFLAGVGVDFGQLWTAEDTRSAHAAWQRHVERRRRGEATRRPLADLLIGGFARRFRGLVTRNARDFGALFPELELWIPGRS